MRWNSLATFSRTNGSLARLPPTLLYFIYTYNFEWRNCLLDTLQIRLNQRAKNENCMHAYSCALYILLVCVSLYNTKWEWKMLIINIQTAAACASDNTYLRSLDSGVSLYLFIELFPMSSAGVWLMNAEALAIGTCYRPWKYSRTVLKYCTRVLFCQKVMNHIVVDL